MSKLPRPYRLLTTVCSLLVASCVHATTPGFAIGLLPFPANSDAALWQKLLHASHSQNLAFVLAHGFKSPQEPCSDQLFLQRKNALEDSRHGVVLSLSAHDWSDCQKTDGDSNALERLAYIRHLFFADEFSLGSSRLEMSRLSVSPKFSTYAENARWDINGILFATLHLPANNNRFLLDAGRNNEYEDRQVANRVWLQRLFAQARNKKYQAVVMFADGSLMGANYIKSGKPRILGSGRQRDGFAELQQVLLQQIENYGGKVLLVDHTANETVRPHLQWRGKLGVLSLPPIAQRYTLHMQIGKQVSFALKTEGAKVIAQD